jgi:hypothetical protein
MNLHLGLAFNLLRRTLPILGVRVGATLAFWFAALIYLAVVGGVSALIGAAVDWLGGLIFFIAIISLIPLYNLAYRYVFYMIKAAHIAVMAELLKNGDLPAGTNQLEWGKQKVQDRFGEMNAMFAIDEIITGVVRAFTGTVITAIRWLPGDALDSMIGVVERIIKYSTNYIDEAVLARSFWTEDEQGVWTNARDGTVLYAMRWKPLLKNAVALMVISFMTGIVGFLILVAPVGAIIAFFGNAQLAGWSVIIVLLLAWLIKVSVGDALAVAAVIATYQRETEGLTPDPEMVARLDSVSDKFSELRQRAEEAIGGTPGAPIEQNPQRPPDSDIDSPPDPASPQPRTP